jgi:hypothetical protein
MERRKRSISRYSHPLNAPVALVFPLLCPVREYEWIEGWQGKLLYSDSGMAELDCVFIATVFEAIGRETWTCSRYEPPYRIDYVRMSPTTVIRLELTLEPQGERSRISATLVATAVDASGDALIDGFGSSTCEHHFKPGFLMLDHYLRTGSRLSRNEALALAAAG